MISTISSNCIESTLWLYNSGGRYYRLTVCDCAMSELYRSVQTCIFDCLIACFGIRITAGWTFCCRCHRCCYRFLSCCVFVFVLKKKKKNNNIRFVNWLAFGISIDFQTKAFIEERLKSNCLKQWLNEMVQKK